MKTLTTMLATGALALTLASSASAQYYAGPTEDVIVRAPHYGPQRSDIGAPIENVSLSREIRFDDLDLRTVWGARALRSRIRETALNLCRQLDTQYVTLDDNRSCYRATYEDAMMQVDDAIRSTRVAAAY
jgi:UrcA family protein